MFEERTEQGHQLFARREIFFPAPSMNVASRSGPTSSGRSWLSAERLHTDLQPKSVRCWFAQRIYKLAKRFAAAS
jgi:hypothetical protein